MENILLKSDYDSLTDRAETMMIAHGITINQIAKLAGVSHHTVTRLTKRLLITEESFYKIDKALRPLERKLNNEI